MPDAIKLFEKGPIERTATNEKGIGTKVLKELDGPSQLRFLKDLQKLTASLPKSACLQDCTIDGISTQATLPPKGPNDKTSGLSDVPAQPSGQTPLRPCTVEDFAGTVSRGACELPKKPAAPDIPNPPFVPSEKFGPGDNPKFQ